MVARTAPELETLHPAAGTNLQDRGQRVVASRPSLLSAVGWISIGTFCYTGAQFVLVVLIARILGVEAVGAYGLAQAVTAPIFMLAHMQLRRIAATDVRNEFPLSAYLFVQLISGGAGLVFAIAIGVLIYPDIALLLIGLALFKWAEALSFVAFGVMQRRGEMRVLGLSMVLRGLMMIPLTAAVLVATYSLTAAVFSSAALGLAFLLVYDLPRLHRCGERLIERVSIDVTRLKSLLRLGLPAGGRTGLTSLTTVLPRYVLEYISGTRAVGFFMALFQLIQLLATANQSAINAIISRMSEHLHADPRHFLSFLGKVLVGASAIAILIVLLGYFLRHSVVEGIYGSEFAPLAPLLPLFLAVASLRLVLGTLTAATVSMRLLTQEFLLMIPTLATAAILSIVLIPSFGVAGAGWALLGSTMINVLCLAALLGRSLVSRMRPAED